MDSGPGPQGMMESGPAANKTLAAPGPLPGHGVLADSPRPQPRPHGTADSPMSQPGPHSDADSPDDAPGRKLLQNDGKSGNNNSSNSTATGSSLESGAAASGASQQGANNTATSSNYSAGSGNGTDGPQQPPQEGELHCACLPAHLIHFTFISHSHTALQ